MYSVKNILTNSVIARFDIRVHAEMFINHCDPFKRFMIIEG
jgi:hypothetical protein